MEGENEVMAVRSHNQRKESGKEGGIEGRKLTTEGKERKEKRKGRKEGREGPPLCACA
jgi:hypothetical protein